MNWKEIKEKYPTALEKLVKDEFPIAVYYLRDLYDFFDKQNILIEISVRAGESMPFFYEIEYISSEMIWECENDDLKYKTRQEAEQHAFLRAFEILEDKLKT
jgi:hypothetical protein